MARRASESEISAADRGAKELSAVLVSPVTRVVLDERKWAHFSKEMSVDQKIRSSRSRHSKTKEVFEVRIISESRKSLERAHYLSKLIENGILERITAEKHEEQIAELVRALAPHLERHPVHKDLELDNAQLRIEYLESIPCFTSNDVHRISGRKGRNASQTASEWKKRGRIFSITHDGRELYPRFQFRDGKPKSVIKKVLEKLPQMTPWQIAFWFETGNGWLGGELPSIALDRDGEAVLQAADREHRNVVG